MPGVIARIILLLLQLVPDAINEVRKLQGQRAVDAADKAVDDFIADAQASSPVGCARADCPLRVVGLRDAPARPNGEASADVPSGGQSSGANRP